MEANQAQMKEDLAKTVANLEASQAEMKANQAEMKEAIDAKLDLVL